MKFQVCNNRYYGKIEDDGTQKIIEWSERGGNPPAELPDNAVVAEWNSVTEIGDLQTLVNDLTTNSSFDEDFITPYITWFDARYPEVQTEKADAVEANMRDWEIFRKTARETFLKNSDWTQAADSPLDESTKQAWATYREALRNIPTTYAAEDLLYLRFKDDGSFTKCTQVNSDNLAPEGTITVLIQSPSNIF